jgi:hypothetical protein
MNPTPKPSTSANMSPVVTGANKVKTPKTTSTEPKTTTTDNTFRQLPGGVLTNWESFLNNDLTYQPAGTSKGGVQSEPYVSMGPLKGDLTPNAVALIASPDGMGYQVKGIDAAVREYIGAIPAANRAYYKKQLSAYYPNAKAFQNSMRQDVTERDLGFEGAVRKAVTSLSVENFNRGKEEALFLKDNPNQASTFRTGLFTFDTFVTSRTPAPATSSESISNSSLTLEADAKAEFRRTVQQYVGDPALVDKVDKLAESYWKKLHAEELKRQSTSTRTVDPITGNAYGSSIGYAPLLEQDRVEMRLNFIVKGDKKIESVGLRQASQEDLEEAGGVIGASYGKLNKIAADYGVQLTHEDLLERVNRAIKPGGVTTGVSPDTMNTGLTAEENSIKTSAKIRFKALAPYIDQGLKVSDISSNFQRLKEKEYGLADNSINIYDDDVMKALSGDGIASTNDFLLGVRSNPAWRKTPKANEMAAEFLNTILKSWGKVG